MLAAMTAKRRMTWISFVLLSLLLGPIGCAMVMQRTGMAPHWSQARWDRSMLAPDPATTPEAVVQIFAARTWGWKAAFAVHSWIVFKPENAKAYERYEVVGWGVHRGTPAVRRNMRPPDGFWAGNAPELVAELRGGAAAAAIPEIEQAIASYPHPTTYVTWPGPNSNTFIGHIARNVPSLRAELPPTAVGKDFLTSGIFSRAPSGTGYQLSLLGLVGILLALDEGFEINVLGLVLGIDPLDLAVKLPGLGRIGWR